MNLWHTIIDYFLLVINNPVKLIQSAGYIGLIAIVFAETGLLVGFFLPGDSLLIAAGLFASTKEIKISILLITLTFAAIIGNSVGFYIGRKLGTVLYQKDDSFFFRKKHITRAHDFYAKHGGKTIIIAQFIPILRTFAPTVAGAASMNYVQFIVFNIIGACFWVWSLLLSGYYLGRHFGDKIGTYIHFIILGVIVVSLLPVLWHWINAKFIRRKS